VLNIFQFLTASGVAGRGTALWPSRRPDLLSFFLPRSLLFSLARLRPNTNVRNAQYCLSGLLLGVAARGFTDSGVTMFRDRVVSPPASITALLCQNILFRILKNVYFNF